MLTFSLTSTYRAVYAQASTESKTAKIKSQVLKRVAEQKNRVKVKLLNGTEVKGTIGSTNEQGFTLTEDKTGKSIDVAYNDVNKVEGRGMGTGTKLGIIAAITAGVLVIIAAVAVHNFRRDCCF
jgi:sRNA-binding regulator protein Hfq